LLVTSQGNGLFESRDGGKSWRSLNGNLPAAAVKEPRGLLLDPADSQHVVTALGGDPEKASGIYQTHDGGHTWQRLNQDPPFADITALAADPQHFNVLYICAREFYNRATGRSYPGGVFKSADAGKSWSRILDYHFTSAIAISPVDEKTLYVCTTDHPFHDNSVAEGVLKSMDGGVSWQHQNQGLSPRNCSNLSIDPRNPGMLYLGTSGNGTFIGMDRAVATKTAGSSPASPNKPPLPR